MNDISTLLAASEVQAIEAQADAYVAPADQAMDDLRVIAARGRDLSKQLRLMRRRLRRNTDRLCAALDGIPRDV